MRFVAEMVSTRLFPTPTSFLSKTHLRVAHNVKAHRYKVNKSFFLFNTESTLISVRYTDSQQMLLQNTVSCNKAIAFKFSWIKRISILGFNFKLSTICNFYNWILHLLLNEQFRKKHFLSDIFYATTPSE